jgi:hypothetical protein
MANCRNGVGGIKKEAVLEKFFKSFYLAAFLRIPRHLAGQASKWQKSMS